MANTMNYPDIYYRVRPYALQVISQWRHAKAPISASTLDAMTDHVCALALQEDPSMQYYYPESDLHTAQFGGGLFRDIIGIILIGELFGRRRRPYPPPPPPPPYPPRPRPY